MGGAYSCSGLVFSLSDSQPSGRAVDPLFVAFPAFQAAQSAPSAAADRASRAKRGQDLARRSSPWAEFVFRASSRVLFFAVDGIAVRVADHRFTVARHPRRLGGNCWFLEIGSSGSNKSGGDFSSLSCAY